MEEEEEKERRECEEDIKQRSALFTNMEKNHWKIIVQNVRRLITAESRETLKLIDDYANNEKIVLMNFTETLLNKTRVARNKNDEWPKFLLKSGQMMKKVAKNIYKNGQKMAKQFIFSFV